LYPDSFKLRSAGKEGKLENIKRLAKGYFNMDKVGYYCLMFLMMTAIF
jgi:hypothetical protein